MSTQHEITVVYGISVANFRISAATAVAYDREHVDRNSNANCKLLEGQVAAPAVDVKHGNMINSTIQTLYYQTAWYREAEINRMVKAGGGAWSIVRITVPLT
jgi:hypothetical protein